MPTVPVLKPREIVKAFEKLGWEVARVYGSGYCWSRRRRNPTLNILNIID